MASFVPDEIIYNIDDYSIRNYNIVLVLGDVSGFTDLSEKYNKTGKGGPSRLTQILNNYIGSMVQEIMRHNGDLLKFSGDAFLAMWKCVGDRSMREVMSQVLACALIIQRSYGRYETDVGVTLKVKLGIAAGPGYFSIIGNEKNRHYVILGESVLDVKLAEHSCSAGEVMLAPSAWKFVNAMEFQHEYHSDGKHVKITGCGETWQEDFKIDEDIVEGPAEEDVRSETQDDVIIMYSDRTPKPEAGPILMSLSGSTMVKEKKPKEFSLRPSVEEAAQKKMKDVLQPFIIPVVMRGVELGEPMEYLTEMRQVVIMFLNIVPYERDWESLIRLVDSSYQVVCTLVDNSHGCVNKVSYFDKDLMMLIIFGLRGYKHEFESQSALMCALDVRIACEALDGVSSASIGVTTGMSYCGVVGHILRREYTVIGVPVNKGARLMVAYPGKVTCDREVFLHSKLDSLHFVLQEPKALKGLQNVGPIYEYKEKPVAQGVSSVSKYPLLGREMELQLFYQMLESLSLRKINPHNIGADKKNTLIMKGEPRLGKTRLLDEMIFVAHGKAMVHKISLNFRDQKVPYKTLQLIFAPSLGLPETASPKEKEDKLMKVLNHGKLSKWFCCLNPVFNVNFTLSREYLNGSISGRNSGLQIIMEALFKACFSQMWVLGIDDCENMDENSWMLLSYLVEADCALLAMTAGTRRQLPECASEIIENEYVKYIELGGIDKWYHAGLVCQIIDVRAIPAELENLLLDNQKKEYHLRAARFIEKETRRCKSCGGGIFTRILRGFNKVSEEAEELSVASPDSNDDFSVEKTRTSTYGTPLVIVESRLSIGDVEADYISTISSTSVRCRLIPMPCFKAEGSSISLTETFSSLDFSNCQCKYDKVMDIVLEFITLTIGCSNHPQSMMLLEEADSIIEVSMK
ncbi:hypothetical protein C0J52_14455 [Blattella germanica]|nr:hypothetical protein C0J52_14455 [Blattella germanica]